MEKLSYLDRLLSVAIVTMVVAVLVTAVILYSVFTKTPQNQLSDPLNDVVLDIGEYCPGMIDVVNGTLEASGTTLKININGRDSLVSLGEGEFAYWNVTLILENNDTLRAYNVWVELNSTGLAGYVKEIGDQNVRTCQVEYDDFLTVSTVFDELPNTKQAEWSVLAVYEKWLGSDLVSSASDIAPDDGLQTTVLRP